jgi:hypothetical protein
MSTIIHSPIRFKLLAARESTIIASPLSFKLLALESTMFIWGPNGERQPQASRVWTGTGWYPPS